MTAPAAYYYAFFVFGLSAGVLAGVVIGIAIGYAIASLRRI